MYTVQTTNENETLFDADFLDGHLTITLLGPNNVAIHLHSYDVCLEFGAHFIQVNPLGLTPLLDTVKEMYYAGVCKDRAGRFASGGERLQ